MKRIFLLLLLLLFTLNGMSAPAAASRPLPLPLIGVLRVVENGMKVWKVASIDPLSQTVKQPFAANSWRIVLERPFETAPVEGLPDPQNKRGMKNNAEIVLVKILPDLEPQDIRKSLTWKVSANELFTTIAYLGTNSEYLCFAKADIVSLDWLKFNLRLRDGDNLGEIIAYALNVEDENNFSRKSAVSIIGNCGNAAIPHIKRAMGIAIADHETIAPHLMAMKNIGTPESARELFVAAKSGNQEARVAVMDALSVPPYVKEMKEIYFEMMEGHYKIVSAIEASIQFNWKAELLPSLRKASHRPISFQEYMIITTTIDQFMRNTAESPELAAVEQIKILLTRSGDFPGSPRILSLSDKATAMNVKLNKEDLNRVKPFEDSLINSKNVDMALAAALALYMYDPGKQLMLSKDYVRRVRQSGYRVLVRLNREKVRSVLMNLKRSVESEEEANQLASLAANLERL